MRRAIILLVFVCMGHVALSQAWMQYLPKEKTEKELTFYDYKNAFNQWCRDKKIDNEGYYVNKSGERQKAYGWKQFKRWEISIDGWYDRSTGEFLYESIGKEIARVYKEDFQNADNLAGNWTPVAYNEEGDGNDGNGRINCVAFHPTNEDVFWVGTAWGGVWKTTDHGDTWTPLSDFILTTGIGSIAVPNDYDVSQTIYIGTGDRGYNTDYGRGIMKSTDGGTTWQETGFCFSTIQDLYINRLLYLPGSTTTLIACTSQGVFKSSDGFTTRDTLTVCRGIDMEFHPGNSDIIYVSTRNRHGDSLTRVLRTIDAGLTWDTVLAVGGPRTELAVSPDEPSWVYAVAGNDENGLRGFYRSIDNGATFQLREDQVNILCGNCIGSASGGQAFYDLAIAASPIDALTVFVGGINVWKTTDGGASWGIATNGYDYCFVPMNVHVDIHWLEFQYNTDNLFVTSDGGIYYSLNNGSTYSNISGGLQINQPYRICSSQMTDEIIMGQQDNGIVLWEPGDVDFVGGGDGTDCLINPLNANKQYFTNNTTSVSFTTNHWSSYHTFTTPGDVNHEWFKPIVLLPPDTVLYGGYDLWKSTENGFNMVKVFDFPTETPFERVAVAESNHNVIMVLNNEHLMRSEDGGVTWFSKNSYLPASCVDIIALEIKANNPDVVWITYNNWDDGVSIYRSTDGGDSWTNISEGLPDCPWTDIIQNDLQISYEEIYAVGYFGVYVKLGGNPWVKFSNGLPHVVSYDLDIKYDGTNSRLRCGTHGRGIWESPLYSPEAGMPGIWTGAYNSDWHDDLNWQYLEIPSADESVTIPAGCQHYPIIFHANGNCTNITVEEGAVVVISGWRLYIYGDATIDGKIKMIGPGAAVKASGDITWQDDALFELSGTNCYFEVEGDWSVGAGSNVDLTGTTVTFKGNESSALYCYSADFAFGNLNIEKSSPFSLIFENPSFAELAINGNFTISPTSRFTQNADENLRIAGSLDAQGYFFQQHGTCIIDAGGTINLAKSNSYFNELTIHSLTLTTLLSNVDVREGLDLQEGILDVSSFTLEVGGDLQKTSGTVVSTTGRLIFDGTGEQQVLDDFHLKFVQMNKPSDTLRVLDGITLEIDSLSWSGGAITLDPGSAVNINELAEDGIFGTYRVNNSSALKINNPTGSVDLNGKLFISGGTVKVYGGNHASYWPGSANAELHLSSGILDFKDRGIFVLDHPTLTFLDNITGGVIRTSRGFQGDHHAFAPAGGYIELYGPNNAELGNGIGSGLYKIVINKESVSDKVTVTSTLDIDNNLVITSGDLDINGHAVDVAGSLNISGKLTMTNPASELNIGTIVTWNSGSSSNITEGLITFRNAWQFQSGTNAQLTGNNTVRAIGNFNTDIYHKDADACFANFVTDKTSLPVYLDASSTYPMRVSGNLTVGTGDMLRVDNADLIVTGTLTTDATSTLEVLAGGTITAGNSVINNTLNLVNGFSYTGTSMTLAGNLNLTTGGTIGLDNFTLNGTLDINSGSVAVHNSFTQNTTGHLVLDGGSFIIDKAYTGNMFGFSGITDLNGGFFEISYEGIQFGAGATVNFNGGNLRIGGHFSAVQASSFQPASGAVELINTIGANIECDNGNYFHQLIINKSAGANPCLLSTPVIIQDDLSIQSGELSTLNRTLTVNGDMLIQTAGRLTAGSSEIYVGGSWTNNRGTIGFSEGTSSVWMTSSLPASLTTETFYMLDVDKALATGQYLAMLANSTLTVSNKLTLDDGVLLMGNNSTINANGDLHFKSGGGLNGNSSASGTVINIKGHWWDYNTITTANQGFMPGYSTVYFTGTDDQDLLATGGVNFYNLTFQNPGNSIFINDNVTVSGNFNLVSGEWYQVTTGLTHTFKGNFTVSDATLWRDAVNTVSFEGSNYQELICSIPGWLNFHTLEVDRPPNAESGSLNILSDINCASRFIVTSGEAVIDGYRLTCQIGLEVEDDGQLSLLNYTSVSMGNDASVNVQGGTMYLSGSESDRPLFTHISTGYYGFQVENGGTLHAGYTDFEYMNGRGINIYENGNIGGTLPFNHCSFRKTEATGTLLQINNSQDITLYHVDFPTNTWSGGSNIKKIADFGNVYLSDADGNFAGPQFEEDPYNRIHWPSTGIWEGDVSTEWHDKNNWRYNYQLPDANTDVVIPSGKPNYPIFSAQESTIKSLEMEPSTSLTISKDSLFVSSWSDIRGNLIMPGVYTALFTDSLVWQAGSSANLSGKSTIYIAGNMFIKHGSDLNMSLGEFKFYGSGESQLICHDTAQIAFVTNEKVAPYNLSLVGDTLACLTLNSSLVNGIGATLRCPSTQEWVINGMLKNADGGHYRFQNGTIRLKGNQFSYFRPNHGDYFNNLIVETTARINLNSTYSDTLRVNGNLVINNNPGGTSGITANNFKIMMMGSWDNNAASTALQAGTSQVVFWNPLSPQEVLGTNSFYDVIAVNDPDSHLRFYDDNTVTGQLVASFPVIVLGNLTVNNLLNNDSPSEVVLMDGSSLQVTKLYQGGKVVNFGGTMTVTDLAEDYVTGNYRIDDGLVQLGQSDYATHNLYFADITINGGELRFTGGSGYCIWPGTGGTATVTMTGGLLALQNHFLQINQGNFTENISGGIITVDRNFYCAPGVTGFHPTGGAVEMKGMECEISIFSPSSWFWDLYINNGNIDGYSFAVTDFKVKNALRVISGILETNGYLITVGP